MNFRRVVSSQVALFHLMSNTQHNGCEYNSICTVYFNCYLFSDLRLKTSFYWAVNDNPAFHYMKTATGDWVKCTWTINYVLERVHHLGTLKYTFFCKFPCEHITHTIYHKMMKSRLSTGFGTHLKS